MNLAIFDLDRTLINCDSDNEWPKYLLKKGLIDQSFVDIERNKFYQDYINGCLDIDEFLKFQLAPLGRFSRAELDKMHSEYLHEYILPNITTMAKMLVQGHRDAGDELLLLSATNEFIITPIARVFGIENVIGVQLETDNDGNYTGGYIGIPSFKEGKVIRLREWLTSRGFSMSGFEKIYFYSDSHNDLPLLKEVSDPVAVNPDEKLAQYARCHGWPILNFM
ncbi:MAG: HAD family hydrolase [Snodgrassella sp.]|nr:HAD family hydrolase [Snodgrassella sp.]